jgi:hypothetical protein
MPGELHKRKFKCEHGIVEFLATGQQFIAVGTHPSACATSGRRPARCLPRLSRRAGSRPCGPLVAPSRGRGRHRAQASVKAQKLADVIANDPVAQFLLDTNRVKRSERDGRLHITCPFEDEHTSDSGDSATTYFPAHTGGYINGHFQCLHAHCEHRSDQEFLDAIEYANPDLASEFAAIADAVAPGSGSPMAARECAGTQEDDVAVSPAVQARTASPSSPPTNSQ